MLCVTPKAGEVCPTLRMCAKELILTRSLRIVRPEQPVTDDELSRGCFEASSRSLLQSLPAASTSGQFCGVVKLPDAQ